MSAKLETSSEADLPHIGRVLWHRRFWVIGPTLASLAAALIFVNVVKPRYAAEARVLLENQENFLTRSEKSARGETTAPDAEAVQSQIQLLTSRDLARRVIKALELQGNAEFDPLANGIGPFKRVLILMGIVRDPTRMTPEDRILEKFSDKLAVLSPTKTRVLSVEFSSENADLAARGANVIADAYLEMQQEAKRDNARVAAASLAGLVADLKARLSEADSRVEDFRSKSGLLIGANNTVIPTQQLGELNNQLSQARAAQADAQAKAHLLRDMIRQGRVGEVPDVSNNEVIRRIFEQRVTLRAQLALESRTLLPQHPRIKELTAQISDLDAQWRNAAERTARTLENDAHIAGSRVENLSRVLEDQKRVAGAAGADEVHLRELERAAQVLKEQFDAESTKYQEALARERLKTAPADARIIQRALAPQVPAFPKKLPIAIFATLAGLILSAGVIVSGELLGARPQIVEADRERHDRGANLAGAVAVLDPVSEPQFFDDEKVDQTDPEAASPAPVDAGARDRQTDAAVVKIDHARTSSTSVKVVVTPCEAEGKSAECAIALGRNLARRGRTLLVAADPGTGRYDTLIAANGAQLLGFAELLAGEAEFSQAIHRDMSSRLQVMPGGSANRLERHDLDAIVEALAHSYDFVLFAASPVWSRRLASLIDMAFVIGGDDAESLREELARSGVAAFLLEDGVSADDLVAA